MKRLLLLTLLTVSAAFSQTNCFQTGTILNTTPPPGISNTVTQCATWTLNITTNGPVAQYSAQLEGDFGSGFTALTASSGANPCTLVTRCTVTYSGPFPNTVRVNPTLLTCVPANCTLTYSLSGSNPQPPVAPTTIIINGITCTLGGSCNVSSSTQTVLAFQYVNTSEASPGSCSGSVFSYTGFASLTTAETVTFSLTTTTTVLIDYHAQLTAAGSSATFADVAVIDGTPSAIQSAISLSSGFVGRSVYNTQVSLGSGSHTIAMQHCGTGSISWQARSFVIWAL